MIPCSQSSYRQPWELVRYQAATRKELQNVLCRMILDELIRFEASDGLQGRGFSLKLVVSEKDYLLTVSWMTADLCGSQQTGYPSGRIPKLGLAAEGFAYAISKYGHVSKERIHGGQIVYV